MIRRIQLCFRWSESSQKYAWNLGSPQVFSSIYLMCMTFWPEVKQFLKLLRFALWLADYLCWLIEQECKSARARDYRVKHRFTILWRGFWNVKELEVPLISRVYDPIANILDTLYSDLSTQQIGLFINMTGTLWADDKINRSNHGTFLAH